MSTQWTDDQRDAIEAEGGTVLVSAAAGSGKTAVLSERVLRRLTDPAHPCDADRLLVVTFTKAAAAEMKQRIADKLDACLERNPGDRALQRQKLLLDHAHISTVHSFCSDLLRAHFHELELSPTFRIAAEDEMLLLSGRAMDELAEAVWHRLRTEPTSGLRELTELFSDDRDDRRLGETVRQLYEYVRSHPFPERWLRKRLEQYKPAPSMEKSAWGAVLFDYARDAAEYGIRLMEGAFSAAALDEKLQAAYQPALVADMKTLVQVHEAAEAHSWDTLTQILQGRTALRLGTARNVDETVKVQVKQQREGAHKLLDTLSGLFDQSEADALREVAGQYEVVNALSELVLEYGTRLDALKKEKNLLDFGDLEHGALRLLVTETEEGGRRTPLAMELAEQYEEVMVDEYQDTNSAQELIFTAVSCGEENLFLVGDVKQSIYRFRQASPELFIKRRDKYPIYRRTMPQFPAAVLLGKNFRSRAGITGACNFLFRQLMSRALGDVAYDASEELVPQAVYPPSDTPDASLILFEPPESDNPDAAEQPEAEWMAARIQTLINAQTPVTQKGVTRPAQYRDFCILLRSAAGRASDILRVLQRHKIPCWGSLQGGFFQSREVAFLLALLRVIDNPMQDVPMLAVLCAPVYGFSADELARVRLGAPKKSLYFALKKAAQEKDDSRAAAFLAELARWRRYASAAATRDLIERIWAEKQLEAVVLAMKDGALRLANLRLLSEYASGYERAGYRGLSGFIRYIDRLQEQRADLAPASILSESANVVRVMTIHHSKGLEFPFVFVADCARQFNRQSLSGDLLLHPRLGAALRRRDAKTGARCPTAAYQAVQTELARDELSEQMRVLYVALTRAREKLFLLCSIQNAETRLARLAGQLRGTEAPAPFAVRMAGSFADWLLLGLLRHPDMGGLRALCGAQELRILPEETRFGFERVLPQCVPPQELLQPEPPQPDQKLLDTLRARFSASTDDPCSRIPVKAAISALAEQRQTEQYAAQRRPAFLSAGGLTPAERGTALHTYLQFADYHAAAADPAAERDRLCKQGYLTDEQAASIELPKVSALFAGALGQRILSAPKLHREVRFLLEYPAEQWTPPATQPGESVVLQGVADCVIEEADHLILIDYKTDRVAQAQTLRERYARQLELYARALEQCFDKPVKQMVLYSMHLGCEILLSPEVSLAAHS